jgi:hypothetical protein
MIQSSCIAPCATYSYVLRGDGTASYEGYAYTPVRGRYSAPLDRARFENLVTMLREKHFLPSREGE